MEINLAQLESAISNSSHSEFYLGGSGLNKHLLLKEINKLILPHTIKIAEQAVDAMRNTLNELQIEIDNAKLNV